MANFIADDLSDVGNRLKTVHSMGVEAVALTDAQKALLKQLPKSERTALRAEMKEANKAKHIDKINYEIQGVISLIEGSDLPDVVKAYLLGQLMAWKTTDVTSMPTELRKAMEQMRDGEVPAPVKEKAQAQQEDKTSLIATIGVATQVTALMTLIHASTISISTFANATAKQQEAAKEFTRGIHKQIASQGRSSLTEQQKKDFHAAELVKKMPDMKKNVKTVLKNLNQGPVDLSKAMSVSDLAINLEAANFNDKDSLKNAAKAVEEFYKSNKLVSTVGNNRNSVAYQARLLCLVLYRGSKGKASAEEIRDALGQAQCYLAGMKDVPNEYVDGENVTQLQVLCARDVGTLRQFGLARGIDIKAKMQEIQVGRYNVLLRELHARKTSIVNDGKVLVQKTESIDASTLIVTLNKNQENGRKSSAILDIINQNEVIYGQKEMPTREPQQYPQEMRVAGEAPLENGRETDPNEVFKKQELDRQFRAGSMTEQLVWMQKKEGLIISDKDRNTMVHEAGNSSLKNPNDLLGIKKSMEKSDDIAAKELAKTDSSLNKLQKTLEDTSKEVKVAGLGKVKLENPEKREEQVIKKAKKKSPDKMKQQENRTEIAAQDNQNEGQASAKKLLKRFQRTA